MGNDAECPGAPHACMQDAAPAYVPPDAFSERLAGVAAAARELQEEGYADLARTLQAEAARLKGWVVG